MRAIDNALVAVSDINAQSITLHRHATSSRTHFFASNRRNQFHNRDARRLPSALFDQSSELLAKA
jgi:hypothetical protein